VYSPGNPAIPSVYDGSSSDPEYYWESFHGAVIHIYIPVLDVQQLSTLDQLSVVVDLVGIVGDISVFVPGTQGLEVAITGFEGVALVIETADLIVNQDTSGLSLEVIKTTTGQLFSQSPEKFVRVAPLLGIVSSIVDLGITTKDAISWKTYTIFIPIY
jgi:hypothetical protein